MSLGGKTVNEQDVRKALAQVEDPELRKNIVELGMVRDIVIDDAHVSVTIALTTPSCPLSEPIKADAERALQAVAGGRRVTVKLGAMTESERNELTHRLSSKHELTSSLFGPGSHTRTIAVASGKGGVGKSTVTANLAVALAQQGQAVALLDADVYGPTIPLMFGAAAASPQASDNKIIPPERYGVKFMSMALFLPNNDPVIWRGPLLGRAIEQFIGDVLWGSPDILLIDLPPGTGDIALTVAQMIPAAEILIVTTPQEAAAKVAIKAAKMARTTKHKLLGVVENMSYFVCPNCNEKHYIFGRGGAVEISQTMGIPVLGSIPLDESTRAGGDSGEPPALHPETPVGAAFHELAKAILASGPEAPRATASAAGAPTAS